MNAAAATFWARGVDGLVTYFAQWPFGDVERRWLGDIGDKQRLASADKTYYFPQRPSTLTPEDSLANLAKNGIPALLKDRKLTPCTVDG